MDLLLIWKNIGYPENGGGTYYEHFDDPSELEDRVNELNKEHGQYFKIEYACKVETEINIVPVEIINKWQVERALP